MRFLPTELSGVVVIEPEEGHLASGLSGLGRLAAPETILDIVRSTLGATGDLAGRRVLVTGAPSGIGAATCRLLAEEGCHVAAVDRQHHELAGRRVPA